MSTSVLSRRTFLQTAAAATVSAGLLRAADAKPRIGLIGCGGMGMGDAKNASRFGQIVAVCDVDAGHAAKAAGQYKGAKVFEDFRKLLERKDVDVVLNATPDHWHTLVNLAAVRAGKDVYSEKPLTLTIDEGKRLVKAVKQTRRVLQTASQQRSDLRIRQPDQDNRAARLGM
jgi:predicted dehydrogenase